VSNLVFPTIVSPPNMSYRWPYKKTPHFTTVVQTPASGRGELRIGFQTFPRWDFTYNLEYVKGDFYLINSFIQKLVGLYGGVEGAADDWLFLDPNDNTIPSTSPGPQQIGVGDGTTVQFLMTRTIGNLVDIIQNFVSAPVIYLNGVAQSSSTYTLDQYGNLTFNTAPGAGVVIAWSGQFYFRCRFLEDSLTSLSGDWYQKWSCHEIKWMSVIL
jgi:uncharacterized protein (TIGR02217 family)